MRGPLITFNSQLTVIGGQNSENNVEVIENESGSWNDTIIPKAPVEFRVPMRLPALVVSDSGSDLLFIFGTNNVWKYEPIGWVQQNNLRRRMGARLVLSQNIILLVGGVSAGSFLRYASYTYSLIYF